MKYDVFQCPIIGKRELARGVYDFFVRNPELANLARAGQFGNILVEGKTLRRPISICDINREQGYLRFVIEVRGEGTDRLCKKEIGDSFDILGPLGNGFSLPVGKTKALFVGGGIGAPPLLFPAKQYAALATVLLGFQTADRAILLGDFAGAGCNIRVATDDGSMGHQGFVTDLARQVLEIEPYGMIYACGPMPMLRALAQLAAHKQIPCQVSLEERMACGVGACLVCACKTVRDGREIHTHVCKDGPVFDSGKVVW